MQSGAKESSTWGDLLWGFMGPFFSRETSPLVLGSWLEPHLSKTNLSVSKETRGETLLASTIPGFVTQDQQGMDLGRELWAAPQSSSS